MCLTGPFIVGGDGAWLAALSLCAGCLGLSLTRLVITAPPVFLLPWLLPWQLGRQQLLLLAVCACGAGASIGAILAPPLFRLLCDWLSWKGACLATAGCLLNWLPEADTSRRPIPASVRDPNYYYCLYYYCKVRGALLTLATDNEQWATAKRKQQSCDSGLGDSMNLSAGASNSRCSGAASRHAVLAPSAESASAAAEVEREELASWQPGSRLQRPGHEAADEHQGQESAAGEEPAAEDDDLLFSSNRNLARLSGDPRLGSSDDVFLDVGTNEGVNNADSDGDAADENDDEADQLLQPPGTPPPVSLSAVGSGGSGAS
uniref:MFS domain-containing protein n=1 Tax=Macrostomum lignano TaxID=282301 RepID=A0A1I8H9U3_9PLAT